MSRATRHRLSSGALLHHCPSTPSTNLLAKEWLSQGAPDGSCVVADQQTAGRGRLDRNWHSPPNANLYCSIIIREPIEQLSRLPILSAVAVRLAVADCLPAGLSVRIKWPNDVLILGYKVAGILIELEQGNEPTAIVGVGVNLNMRAGDFPSGLRRPAASLAMFAGRRIHRWAFTERVLQRFAFWREQPEKILTEYRQHCGSIGQEVAVDLPTGSQITGRAISLDNDGSLVVAHADGQRTRIQAGDVLD